MVTFTPLLQNGSICVVQDTNKEIKLLNFLHAYLTTGFIQPVFILIS